MIICICKNISSKKIKKMIDDGLNRREIIKITGLSKQCGTCKKCFNDFFKN